MKKFKLLTLLLTVLALAAGLCACGEKNPPPDGGTQTAYEITLNEDLSRTLHVGDEVDFTKYFTVTDEDGNPVAVTADMLDLSKADTSAPGSFTVTLTVGEVKKSAEFTVLPQGETPPAEEKLTELKLSPTSLELIVGKTGQLEVERVPATAIGEEIEWTTDDEEVATVENGTVTAVGVGTAHISVASKDDPSVRATAEVTVTADPMKTLADVLKTYDDLDAWNFAVTRTETYDIYSFEDYYEYLGRNVLNAYEDSFGDFYTDYLAYDEEADEYAFFCDNGDDTYERYAEGTDDYDYWRLDLYLVDIQALKSVTFTYADGVYSAQAPATAAEAVLGEYLVEDEDTGDLYIYTYTSLTLTLADGRIAEISATIDGGTEITYVFSDYGEADFTLPAYDPNEEDRETLAAALETVKDQTIEGTTELKTAVDGVQLTWTLNTVALPNGITFSGHTITVTDRPATDTVLEFTVKATLNNVSSTKLITVTLLGDPNKLTGLGFIGDTINLTEGEEQVLNVVRTPSSATEELKWTSDTPAVATVESDGTVKAVGVGQAHITVECKRDPSIKATVTVIVIADSEKLSSLTLEPATLDIIVGTTGTLTVHRHPISAVAELKWTSSDDETATVENGKVTGLKQGTVTITVESVEDPSIKATATVTVKAESSTPSTPQKDGFNPITSPIAGTEYYLGVEFDGEWHYFTGYTTNTYYLEISADIADAQKLTLEANGSGWVIRFGSQYVEVAKGTGTHYNAVISDSQTSGMVWVWNSEYNIFTMTVDGTEYYLGTYENTNQGFVYDSISASSINKADSATSYLASLGTYKAPSGGGTDTPVTPSGTMEKQTYDAATFDDRGLQEQTLDSGYAIGLPSTGTYNALVIPVQFKGDTITDTQMANLRKAFNGTETDTGWESVKTYYEKSSYGNLKLSFDIQEVYQAKNSASYYERYTAQNADGSTRILEEVLAYYESKLDLTKYDTNDDGCIDAVYLIYSAPVDYDTADFYWAYVTWYYGNTTYDGLDAYYYLFAGFDFMDENTARDTSSAEKISGLKINASTYIHESGHLLGLDDYYDYEDKKGSNEGLGNADMMDYTVGDQNVYSKTMLGWLSPTVVNGTKTVTLKPSVSEASAILIPLSFNNSYFSEYLMIDLYAATGLNQMHAGMDNSYLYDGAPFGVRIYHVSSSINNPYSTDYKSFTDYNNSDTKYSLIKLVEADGTKKFSDSNGAAAADDLWKAGQKLSTVFPNYTRNDGKTLNFDVEIVSASAAEAQITITFNS